MKRPGGAMVARPRHDVENIHIHTASNVPRETWLWMEQMIREEDQSTRYKAQDILQPRDARMRYIIAILAGGRTDAVGRSLRMTRIMNYSETRPYAPREHDENNEAGEDKGRVHTKMKWGWKLYKSMTESFEKEAP